jgi:hypothetical protein
MNLDETKSEITNLASGRKDFQLYSKANLPRKIEALIDHKDFQSKLAWIAKRLDTTLEETQEALDLLETLGIISWENGTIRKLIAHNFILDQVKDKSSATLVADHRIISHQLLNDVDPEKKGFVRNGFATTDEDIFTEYYKKIVEVQKWFIEASLKSKKSMVVGFTYTCTNIIKSNDGDLK